MLRDAVGFFPLSLTSPMVSQPGDFLITFCIQVLRRLPTKQTAAKHLEVHHELPVGEKKKNISAAKRFDIHNDKL